MSYLADDSAAIKARLEEIAAEKRLALTGSSAPEQPKEVSGGYGEYAMGWTVAADFDPA
jgi:hypothetical protein